MNKIYLNIKHAEESRIIVTRGDSLINFEQEYQGEESKKGNIHKGIVTNIEPSLEAVFVDFGENKNGLLPLREIPENALGVSKEGVQVGDKLLVQVKKDNIGDKGAGLTGYISLAGNFLVLMPYRDGLGITSSASTSSREEIGQIANELPVPENMGIIVRSRALNHSKEDITWDLQSYLLRLWEAIKSTADSIEKPTLIYRENDSLLRTMRDHFRPDHGDIVICDHYEKYEELKAFVQLLFPDKVEQIHYYAENQSMVPQVIEQKIDQIYMREVSVASGVRVVFDSTEALVAIDVNSGRQRDGSDIEETALKTNLKAAEIICEQLRLRNLGGLIVIDFIDMKKRENRDALERRVAELIRKDRARTRISKISEFGLMELSRQRTSRSLLSSQTKECPRCNGWGQVWREQTFALHLLRKISDAAFHESTRSIIAQVPRESGVFLLNEKREDLQTIESNARCNIIIMPDNNMLPPQYKLKPIKGGKNQALETAENIMRQEEVAEYAYKEKPSVPVNNPVLRNMFPQETMPSKKAGFLKKLLSSVFGDNDTRTETARGRKSGGAHASGHDNRNKQRGKQKSSDQHKKRANNGKKQQTDKTSAQRKNTSDAAAGRSAQPAAAAKSPRRQRRGNTASEKAQNGQRQRQNENKQQRAAPAASGTAEEGKKPIKNNPDSYSPAVENKQVHQQKVSAEMAAPPRRQIENSAVKEQTGEQQKVHSGQEKLSAPAAASGAVKEDKKPIKNNPDSYSSATENKQVHQQKVSAEMAAPPRRQIENSAVKEQTGEQQKAHSGQEKSSAPAAASGGKSNAAGASPRAERKPTSSAGQTMETVTLPPIIKTEQRKQAEPPSENKDVPQQTASAIDKKAVATEWIVPADNKTTQAAGQPEHSGDKFNVR